MKSPWSLRLRRIPMPLVLLQHISYPLLSCLGRARTYSSVFFLWTTAVSCILEVLHRDHLIKAYTTLRSGKTDSKLPKNTAQESSRAKVIASTTGSCHLVFSPWLGLGKTPPEIFFLLSCCLSLEQGQLGINENLFSLKTSIQFCKRTEK